MLAVTSELLYRAYTLIRATRMKFLKPLSLLLVLLLLGWILYLPATREFLFSAARWAETEPFLAAPAYFIFLIVAVVLMFPVWGVLMIGGYLFGAVWGGLLAWLAYQIGALLAFLFARTIGRDWVTNRFSHSENFRKFETNISKNGFKAILLMRGMLVFPANLINLFAGISAIKKPSYIVATAVGSIPLTLFYTFLGAKSSNLINALADGTFTAPKIPTHILVMIVTTVILLAVVFVVRSKRKRKSPNEH